ncbi:MAG: bifunctional phosphopantothenoylcysteine decarboxylase/phosphopantothenate--cysteine ligase CoaBC [Saprospiraceae bacterium]|nr:bifunctional phosphopantothenoylcysteine decarboxylase/phosphopantothenate--cysteine ligase CoaBC [Saprospiraceae bacterium]
MSLDGKNIILGISGSIAAYKSAVLARLLIKSGARVRTVFTPDAQAFITPLTISALTGDAVYHDISDQGQWNNHVELGLWADLMIIAPATANTLGKMANGICDNMLLATYLSAKCPVYVAPAMDLDMWKHPSTRRNLSLLANDGVRQIPVGYGLLASGLVGDGRMAEPDEIIQFLLKALEGKQVLQGKKVLITAGPTQEAIDPVRFISNHSSGKMGVAVAEAAEGAGAEVHLVHGPLQIPIPSGIHTYPVKSAAEMLEKMQNLNAQLKPGILIFTAAVADYRVSKVSDQKIKKETTESLNLALELNPDIALTMGEFKQNGALHVIFALESENGAENARKKLKRKNADMVVLNMTGSDDAGFGVDTNKVSLIFKDDRSDDYPVMSKKEVAQHIISAIASLLDKNNH